MEKKPGAIVLIHGAWHDSWCWNLVAQRLTAAGIEWFAPDLPMRSFREDQAVVREIISDPTREFVVVGHSRGARVMSFATYQAPQVRHLVFMAGDVPYPGKASLDDRIPMPLTRETSLPAGDRCHGYTIIDPAVAPQMFYADCDPELTAEACRHLRPTRTEIDADVAGMGVGWPTIPSTYILSTDDQCVHPNDQRRVAARVGDVIEVKAGHSAMLSQPALVTDIVIDRSQRAGVVSGQRAAAALRAASYRTRRTQVAAPHRPSEYSQGGSP